VTGGLVGLLPAALGRGEGWLTFAPPIVLVLLVLASLPGSYLDHNRLGGERWVRLLAVPLVLAYPFIAPWLASSDPDPQVVLRLASAVPRVTV